MSDSVMLVCAVCGALAAGVLAAYGVCLGMFSAFRIHARQTAMRQAARVESGVSGAASIVGG